MRHPLRGAFAVLAVSCGLSAAAGAEGPGPAGPPEDPAPPSAVTGVLRQAEAAGKKAVVLFRRKEPEGVPMARAYDTAREKLSEKALFLSVEADDPGEAAAARRYQIHRLDGPAILVLAADGTLLAGFMEAPEPAQVERVLASKALPSFQRAMAGGSLLLVAVGDPKAEASSEALAQARAYAGRAKGGATVLQVDATDPAEAFLLDRLGVKAADGVVLCVLKAGRPVGRVSGEISAARIAQLLSDCDADGCGPGG